MPAEALLRTCADHRSGNSRTARVCPRECTPSACRCSAHGSRYFLVGRAWPFARIRHMIIASYAVPTWLPRIRAMIALILKNMRIRTKTSGTELLLVESLPVCFCSRSLLSFRSFSCRPFDLDRPACAIELFWARTSFVVLRSLGVGSRRVGSVFALRLSLNWTTGRTGFRSPPQSPRARRSPATLGSSDVRLQLRVGQRALRFPTRSRRRRTGPFVCS